MTAIWVVAAGLVPKQKPHRRFAAMGLKTQLNFASTPDHRFAQQQQSGIQQSNVRG